MKLTKAVNNISESAMSNLKKPIKLDHLQKLANQLVLNGTHVKEMAETSTILFIKAR